MKPISTLKSGKRVFLLKDEKDMQRLSDTIKDKDSDAYLGTYILPNSYPVIAIEAGISLLGRKTILHHYAIIRIDEIDKLRLHE